MSKYWRHFKTVCKHKWYVFKECRACGFTWLGIVHDLSKFGPSEFISSARHFQGDRSPIDAEKEKLGYSKAWLHHKSHNKHHWEYWTDFADDGSVIANELPFKYLVEMICDWIGAGKAYRKEEWTPDEPLKYYNKVEDKLHLHLYTKGEFVFLLSLISQNRIEEFHKYCRRLKNYRSVVNRAVAGGYTKEFSDFLHETFIDKKEFGKQEF